MNAFQLNASAMLLGLILDLIVGDPEWFPHPIRLIGMYIAFSERTLRKCCGGRLRAAAVFLTASTVALAMLVTWLILALARRLGFWPYLFCMSFLSWTCVSCRCMAKEAEGVRAALSRGIAEVRKQLSRIVGRDTDALNEEEIIKATVETVAENTTDGVVSPLIYLALGGPILAMGFKAASTLDSMVGYLDERYRDIGWSSARLDDLLNYVPARICALVMCATSAPVGLDAKNAMRIVLRDHANHKSPNCAWSEAAAAGALHIRLGGTHLYFGKPVEKPTIGDDDRPAEAEDIRRICRLLYATTFVAALLLALPSLLTA